MEEVDLKCGAHAKTVRGRKGRVLKTGGVREEYCTIEYLKVLSEFPKRRVYSVDRVQE